MNQRSNGFQMIKDKFAVGNVDDKIQNDSAMNHIIILFPLFFAVSL